MFVFTETYKRVSDALTLGDPLMTTVIVCVGALFVIIVIGLIMSIHNGS